MNFPEVPGSVCATMENLFHLTSKPLLSFKCFSFGLWGQTDTSASIVVDLLFVGPGGLPLGGTSLAPIHVVWVGLTLTPGLGL